MDLFRVTVKKADEQSYYQGKPCGYVLHPRVAEFVVCDTLDRAIETVRGRYKADAVVLAAKKMNLKPVILLPGHESEPVPPPIYRDK